MSTKSRFAALFATNFCGVMNDNYLKMLVVFVATAWVAPQYRDLIITLTPGALVFPYLIFSPLAGKLPQMCNKVTVVRWAKIAEIPIMIIAIGGFCLHNIWIALTSVLIMGLQSALFSPSKYGLIKDIGGAEGISHGMGVMEAIAFMGMLLGTVLAATMADNASQFVQCSLLILLATLGLLFAFVLNADEEKEAIDTPIGIISFLKSTSKLISKYRGLNGIIHVLSVFWWLSATLQMVVVIYCSNRLGLNSTQQGILLAIVAVGISAGCVVGGQLDKHYFMLGLVPAFGLTVGILLLVIFFADLNTVWFTTLVFAAAFTCGLFKIPLDAEIQKQTDISELNIVLAYFNQISFIYIFAASATTSILTMFFDVTYVFLFAALVMFAASFYIMFNYRPLMCNFGLRLMHLHYNVTITGREKLVCNNGENLFILPAHRAVIDPMLLFTELYDVRMQPMVDEGYFRIPLIGHVLGEFDSILVPDLTLSRNGLEQAKTLTQIGQQALANGSNLLIYPSGHITTNGQETIGSRRLAYELCSTLPQNTKVVTIKIAGLWGSQWSRFGIDHTPSIVRLLLKSLALMMCGAILFIKKRNVSLIIDDITEPARQWAQLDKMEFNRKLEDWLNKGIND